MLREYFVTFGIPQEYASDDGPQFKSGKLQKFFKTWGVHYRLSSTCFPHSNACAEIAVKTAKRCLNDNLRPRRELNKDSYLRAILQYRNSPLK